MQLLLAGIVCLPLLAQSARDGTYNGEKEATFGAYLAAEIGRSTTAVADPSIRSYVEHLGQQLAAQFPAADTGFRFRTVTDALGGRTHEPVALPGGYIFVSTRLLLDAQDEAEVAGMLAHAMAHLADHDAARMAARRQITNAGSVPLVFAGGWNSGDQEAPLPSGLLAVHRTCELEADREAARAISAAGYDPHAFARYLGRLQPADRMFSPLPPRSERLAAVDQAIRQLPDAAPAPSNDEFTRIQELIRRLEPVHRPTLHRVPPSLLRPGEGNDD